MANQKTPKISIGITSLSVILCVLCITVFSVLTLSTAISEKKLSEKRASAAEMYYNAETQATELANALISSADKIDFAKQNNINVKENDGNLIFCYNYPIDDKQELFVELIYSNEWKVTRWQVVPTAEWTPDESLDVWDGEMYFEE